MGKHKYRAVEVKQIDEGKLGKAVKGKRVVLGVDVAKEVCFGRLVDETGRVLVTVKWKQIGETETVLAWLKGLGASRVEVAMEPSSTYGDALRCQLGRAGLPVFRVSGKRTHDAAEVYDGVPSMHDPKDADIVARLHLDGASQPWREKSEQERELGALVQTMAMYDEQYHQALNRIEAQLGRHWPELTTVIELDSVTLLGVLERFGSPQAVGQDVAAAAKLMQRVGGRFLSPSKIKQAIESARRTMGVPMIEAERRALQELASEADRCRKAAAKARKKVEQASAGNEVVNHLAAVVGKTTAAVLVVNAGAPEHYGCASTYVKAMGLKLKERSSGKYKGQLRITKRGPSDVRHYLYLAVLRMIRQRGDAVMRAWYLRKVKRDGGRHKKKAVVALMRKLAAALWHVGKGETFDSRLLFAVRKLWRELAERQAV